MSRFPLHFLRFFNRAPRRAFDKVRDLLLKQVHRPWMKRYLKRDEILRMISDCDVGLTEALGRFSVSKSFLVFIFYFLFIYVSAMSLDGHVLVFGGCNAPCGCLSSHDICVSGSFGML